MEEGGFLEKCMQLKFLNSIGVISHEDMMSVIDEINFGNVSVSHSEFIEEKEKYVNWKREGF